MQKTLDTIPHRDNIAVTDGGSMADCGVCIDNGDFDAPAFYTQDDVRARKPHVCCECHDTIPRGAFYERTAGCWDGEVKTYCTCLACVDIATSLTCDGTRLHGGLWEALGDIGAEAFGASCLARLSTPDGKAKLQAWWMQQMELES